MKPKQAISALLLLFVFGSVAYMTAKELGVVAGTRDASIEPDGTVAIADGIEPKLVAYFFYGDKRCATCTNLKEYAREALDTHFSAELASGALQWRTLNMDDPQNEHYIADYELYTQSLVLVGIDDGEQVRWSNLERIWDLVYDKPAYLEYVRTNVRDFLSPAP